MMDIEDVRDNLSDYTKSELLAINDYIGYQIDDLKNQWSHLNTIQSELLAMVHELEELEGE